jgi:transposase
MEVRFVGIDLHKKTIVAAIRMDGKTVNLLTFENLPAGIEKLKTELKENDYVAIEASTQAFDLHDRIIDKVKKCIIVNSRKFKIISDSTSKTDKKDAKLLAEYLSYDDLLPEVYVPDPRIRQLRSLVKSYNLLNDQIVKCKNRIHSLLMQNGIDLAAAFIFDKSNRKAILNCDFAEENKFQIKVFWDILDNLDDKKIELRERILYFSQFLKKEIKLLTSVSGISAFIAIVIMSDIANISRFKNAKHLCSYLGVVPRVDNSGERERSGRIHKESRKATRTILTQVVTHLKNNSISLNEFYTKKKDIKGAGKARIALIRKIITAIYHMLKKEEYAYYRVESKHFRKLKEYENLIYNLNLRK